MNVCTHAMSKKRRTSPTKTTGDGLHTGATPRLSGVSLETRSDGKKLPNRSPNKTPRLSGDNDAPSSRTRAMSEFSLNDSEERVIEDREGFLIISPSGRQCGKESVGSPKKSDSDSPSSSSDSDSSDEDSMMERMAAAAARRKQQSSGGKKRPPKIYRKKIVLLKGKAGKGAEEEGWDEVVGKPKRTPKPKSEKEKLAEESTTRTPTINRFAEEHEEYGIAYANEDDYVAKKDDSHRKIGKHGRNKKLASERGYRIAARAIQRAQSQ